MIPGTDRYVSTCVLVYFPLSSIDYLSILLLFLEKYTHTGDQNDVTSPASTHSTAQGNQLCV